jgi:prepilin-type N-terminal cleavage/methylation domain-containing protein
VRRRAFTLIEVMVALVVTGLVVSMAYATMQAGLDTSDRLAVARDGDEREIVARNLLTQALRHAVPGTIGGAPVFVLRDQPQGDELQFLTRGVSEPLGVSELWEISIQQTSDGTRITGRDPGNPARSFASTLRRVASLNVRVRGRDFRDGWLESWNATDRSPVAVSIEFMDAGGRRVGAPLLARVGLEGNP